jgi:hypothetical protein
MHPNAEFATKLKSWVDTKVDNDDVVSDAQKRGFITPCEGQLVLTTSGEKFIAKWTAGKPTSTYERKPVETHHAASSQTRNDSFLSRARHPRSRSEGYSSSQGRSFQRRENNSDYQPPRSY